MEQQIGLLVQEAEMVREEKAEIECGFWIRPEITIVVRKMLMTDDRGGSNLDWLLCIYFGTI